MGASEGPNGMISVEEYARANGETPETVIAKIREGAYVGQIVGEKWFVDPLRRNTVDSLPRESVNRQTDRPQGRCSKCGEEGGDSYLKCPRCGKKQPKALIAEFAFAAGLLGVGVLIRMGGDKDSQVFGTIAIIVAIMAVVNAIRVMDK